MMTPMTRRIFFWLHLGIGIAVTGDAGTGGEVEKRTELLVATDSGKILRTTRFADNSLGQHLRGVVRFTHTGEEGGDRRSNRRGRRFRWRYAAGLDGLGAGASTPPRIAPCQTRSRNIDGSAGGPVVMTSRAREGARAQSRRPLLLRLTRALLPLTFLISIPRGFEEELPRVGAGGVSWDWSHWGSFYR
jgi:hypothetical protein